MPKLKKYWTPSAVRCSTMMLTTGAAEPEIAYEADRASCPRQPPQRVEQPNLRRISAP